MSEESKLMKNTVIIAIGNIFTKCVSFFMLPLYMLLLTTEQYVAESCINGILNILLTKSFHTQGELHFKNSIFQPTK